MIFRIFILVALVCGSLSAYAQNVQFFSAFQDIPLMPGLTELGEQGVVYDKPGGRFAESLADLGGQEADVVMAYYDAAMPQFGWKKMESGAYSRENERLSLQFESFEGRQVLRLSIEPL